MSDFNKTDEFQSTEDLRDVNKLIKKNPYIIIIQLDPRKNRRQKIPNTYFRLALR